MGTRSSVGGTPGNPSVHPCWKQNSPATTSSSRYRLNVSAAAIDASSSPGGDRRGRRRRAQDLMARQYSAAPGSAPSARAGQREDAGGGDGERRHQERIGERAEKSHRPATGSDHLAEPGDSGDDAPR